LPRAPSVDRRDIQDRPLGELRGCLDHFADFGMKAVECAHDLFTAAQLPSGLRMPLALRAGHQINLVARLFDVIDQDVAVGAPPFGAIPQLHASEQSRGIDRAMSDRADEA
jgi:hypothetical protein